MLKKKGFFALLLVLAVVSSSLPVSAATDLTDLEDNHDHESMVKIDWSDYVDELAEVTFELRISEELKPEIKEIVLQKLALDGVIPEEAAFANFLEEENEYVLEQFIEDDSNVEIFRVQMCCSRPSPSVWQGISTLSHVSGNVCSQHCTWERLICANCGAMHDQRHMPYGAAWSCSKLTSDCRTYNVWGTCSKAFFASENY